MFKSIFKLPRRAVEHEDAVAELVVESFNSFCLKLNEQTLRPIIVNLTKWAAGKSEFNADRAYMLVKVYNGVICSLKEFFVPCLNIYFDALILQSIQWTF